MLNYCSVRYICEENIVAMALGNERVERTLKRRKRVVKDSNGLIQNELNHIVKRGGASLIRQKIALNARANERTAEKGRSEVLTYGTQIRKSVPPPSVWEGVDNAYSTLHTYEQGSLAHFLLAVHALGFRVFSKAPAAMQFLASKEIEQYEQGFRAKVEAQKAIDFPTLTISKIYGSLTTSVRGREKAQTLLRSLAGSTWHFLALLQKRKVIALNWNLLHPSQSTYVTSISYGSK